MSAELIRQFGVKSDIKIILNKIDQPGPEVNQATSTSKDQALLDESACLFYAENDAKLKNHNKTPTNKCKKIMYSQCNYKAGSDSNLKCHVSTRHTNFKQRRSSVSTPVQSFACKLCPWKHKNANAKFGCKFCQKLLTCNRNLLRHAKICKHNPKQQDSQWVQKQKKFKCKLCDYSACTKGQVDIHTRSHTGERPYACSVCSFASAVLGNLNNHMKTHTQVKEFKCLELECNYEGRSKLNLIRHMERQHYPEKRVKDYKCELCPKSFYSRQDLYGHILFHTQERPFPCQFCEYSCTSSGNLKKHPYKQPFVAVTSDFGF